MSGQTWTPAPKRGVIPLHPMTFGMLLGKPFAALRHNPKVLFGFGVLVQLAVVLLSSAVMGFVFFTTFSRLQTVPMSSPDYGAILAGTVAMNIVAGVAVGLASVAFTSIMQGLVAAEVGFAALGVKSSLRGLWRRMAPAFWRLAAFSSLSVLAVFAVIVIVFAIVMAIAASGNADGGLIAGVAIIIVLAVIAAIPLTVWLSTKLLLVPSVLVLERATFASSFVRSWRLTRGRFWVAFGVTFIIGAIMGIAMQIVALPASLLSGMVGGILVPTGDPEPSAFIGFFLALLLPQILILVIQAIALVVQSTAGTLVYLDSRMRYEGLDQTLISHLEHRDLGWSEEQLGDPFAVDPARAVTDAPPPRQVPDWVLAQSAYAGPQGYVGAYPGQGQFPQPPQPGYAQPGYGYASPPPSYAPQLPPYAAGIDAGAPPSAPAAPASAPPVPAAPASAPEPGPAAPTQPSPEASWAPPTTGDSPA